MSTVNGPIKNADLCELAIKGGEIAYRLARQSLDAALARHGAVGTVEYPETAYELPVVFGWDGAEIKTLSDLEPVLARTKGKLGGAGLDGAFAAADALMVSAEVIEALKYADNPRPYEGTDYCGFIPDRVLRSLGLALVDDTIPGVAVLLGQAADTDALVKLVRDLPGEGLVDHRRRRHHRTAQGEGRPHWSGPHALPGRPWHPGGPRPELRRQGRPVVRGGPTRRQGAVAGLPPETSEGLRPPLRYIGRNDGRRGLRRAPTWHPHSHRSACGGRP